MRTIGILALAGALVCMALWSGSARGEDEGEGELAPLSMRLYSVGALTHGRATFSRSFPAVRKPPARGLAADPLDYACEDEPIHPVGTIDEIIELVRSRVLPAYWEEVDGAAMAALGEGGLLARAAPGVHAEIARYLAELERHALRTIAVDVHTVRLSAEALRALLEAGDSTRLDAARVEALLAGEGRGPSARLICENGRRGEVFGGVQRTYLRRHEAVATRDGGTTVPCVGVTNPGLNVAVQPLLHDGERSIRVRLDVAWSDATRRPPMRTAGQEIVELPGAARLDVETDLVLAPGTWALAHAVSGGWCVLTRAVPASTRGFTRRAQAIVLDAPFEARPGPMEVRDFDIGSLSAVMEHIAGRGAYLYDTAADGPHERGTPEPTPALGAEAVVELLRECLGEESTWEDPASIEVRGGLLIVRNTRPVLAAIETWLQTLKRQVPVVYTTHVELVEVEPALARSLLAHGASSGGAGLLDEAGREALRKAQAEERAAVLAGGLLRSVSGVRNTLREGTSSTYLGTYAAVPKRDEVVIEPVTASSFAGLELDLVVRRAPGWEAALVEARCTFTRPAEPTRRLETRHGEIELPALETVALRTTLSVPLGSTALVGAAPHGERQVLLLLTPRTRAR